MATSLPHKLAHLQYQYGLFLFLMAFAPLIPGFTYAHVHAYLALFSKFNPDISSTKEGIKLVFGKVGLESYEQFKRNHQEIILPNFIFNRFYRDGQPEAGLKLISQLFFDKAQRAYHNADLNRATVIHSYPHLFSVYSSASDRPLRSRLLQMLASLIEIDVAIPPRLAAIDTVKDLITAQPKALAKKKR